MKEFFSVSERMLCFPVVVGLLNVVIFCRIVNDF